MRLIDADALIKEDFTDRFLDSYDNTVFETIIETAPTIDIKTEVAREIFEEIYDTSGIRIDRYDNVYLTLLFDKYEELKNKYTKENKNENI